MVEQEARSGGCGQPVLAAVLNEERQRDRPGALARAGHRVEHLGGEPRAHLAAMDEGIGEIGGDNRGIAADRSEEHTSELQSLMRNSYAVFCLQKTKYNRPTK